MIRCVTVERTRSRSVSRRAGRRAGVMPMRSTAWSSTGIVLYARIVCGRADDAVAARPPRGLEPVVGADAAEDAAQVGLHRLRADVRAVGDDLVRGLEEPPRGLGAAGRLARHLDVLHGGQQLGQPARTTAW